MSELSKSQDLESSSTRGHSSIVSTTDMNYRVPELMLLELRALREAVSTSNVELRRIKNKLWNIEEAINKSYNEPEYNIDEEEH